MKQISLAEVHASYSVKPQRTRKQIFLEEMNRVVPWRVLESLIEPHYPKAGSKGGRRATGLAVQRLMSSSITVLICPSFDNNTCAGF